MTRGGLEESVPEVPSAPLSAMFASSSKSHAHTSHDTGGQEAYHKGKVPNYWWDDHQVQSGMFLKGQIRVAV